MVGVGGGFTVERRTVAEDVGGASLQDDNAQKPGHFAQHAQCALQQEQSSINMKQREATTRQRDGAHVESTAATAILPGRWQSRGAAGLGTPSRRKETGRCSCKSG